MTPDGHQPRGGASRSFCCCRSHLTALCLSIGLAGPLAGQTLPQSAAPAERALGGIDIAIVQDQSRWEESDAQGRHLLTETGLLHGLRLGAHGYVAPGLVAVRWTALQGQRDYDGLTNLGRPVTSTTQLRTQTWDVSLAIPLQPAWQLTLAEGLTLLHRTLAGTANAAGYAEHWRWWQTSAGLRWTGTLAGGELSLGAARRWSHHHTVTADLPAADPVTLHPGAGTGWHGSIGYLQPLPRFDSRPWRLRVEWQWQSLATGASPAAPVLRNGGLRGSAIQPAVRMRDRILSFGVQTDW